MKLPQDWNYRLEWKSPKNGWQIHDTFVSKSLEEMRSYLKISQGYWTDAQLRIVKEVTKREVVC